MPRTSKTAQAKPAPTPADPLADLREPDAERYPEQGPDGNTPQDGQEGPQEGPGAPERPEGLSTLVGEALGAASMCWDPKPEGVFQSEEASAIVDALLADLQPMLDPTPVQAMTAEDAVARWHANTVALGFLHKGGRCGCLYVAQIALGA